MVIRNYPRPMPTGMRDYSRYMGYSKDGKSVIACGAMVPRTAKGDEKGNMCFVNDGASTKKVTLEGNENPFVGPALAAALHTLRDGFTHELVDSATGSSLMPPSLVATWGYARDITLEVQPTDGGGVLRFGGRYAQEGAVYPVSLAAKSSYANMVFSGEWNAILHSSTGNELALIGHFSCMEWCTELVISRLSHDRIASLVYNDTGFRHHQAKAYGASRDLFLKATWANPRAPLPPYNLACAYALLGDAPNAEKALRLALGVAGDSVKARAKKDSDFKDVASTKWFRDLTD